MAAEWSSWCAKGAVLPFEASPGGRVVRAEFEADERARSFVAEFEVRTLVKDESAAAARELALDTSMLEREGARLGFAYRVLTELLNRGVVGAGLGVELGVSPGALRALILSSVAEFWVGEEDSQAGARRLMLMVKLVIATSVFLWAALRVGGTDDGEARERAARVLALDVSDMIDEGMVKDRRALWKRTLASKATAAEVDAFRERALKSSPLLRHMLETAEGATHALKERKEEATRFMLTRAGERGLVAWAAFSPRLRNAGAVPLLPAVARVPVPGATVTSFGKPPGARSGNGRAAKGSGSGSGKAAAVLLSTSADKAGSDLSDKGALPTLAKAKAKAKGGGATTAMLSADGLLVQDGAVLEALRRALKQGGRGRTAAAASVDARASLVDAFFSAAAPEAESMFALKCAANACASTSAAVREEHGVDAERATLKGLVAARDAVLGRELGWGARETAAAFAAALAAVAAELTAAKRGEVAALVVGALLEAGVGALAVTARAIKQMEDAREEIKLDKLRFDESLDEYTRNALMALRDFQTVDQQIVNAEDDFQVRSTAAPTTPAEGATRDAEDRDAVAYDLRGEEADGEEWEDVTR